MKLHEAHGKAIRELGLGTDRPIVGTVEFGNGQVVVIAHCLDRLPSTAETQALGEQLKAKLRELNHNAGREE